MTRTPARRSAWDQRAGSYWFEIRVTSRASRVQEESSVAGDGALGKGGRTIRKNWPVARECVKERHKRIDPSGAIQCVRCILGVRQMRAALLTRGDCPRSLGLSPRP